MSAHGQDIGREVPPTSADASCILAFRSGRFAGHPGAQLDIEVQDLFTPGAQRVVPPPSLGLDMWLAGSLSVHHATVPPQSLVPQSSQRLARLRASGQDESRDCRLGIHIQGSEVPESLSQDTADRQPELGLPGIPWVAP